MLRIQTAQPLAQIAATAPAAITSMTAATNAITSRDGQLSARMHDHSATPLQLASWRARTTDRIHMPPVIVHKA